MKRNLTEEDEAMKRENNNKIVKYKENISMGRIK